MTAITVSNEQFAASQAAMIKMLEDEYAIRNQSPSKIKHLTSVILNYTNFHQLEVLLKAKQDVQTLTADNLKKCRHQVATIAKRMMVKGTPLSGLYVCDSCLHIDMHDEMTPAKHLSERLDENGIYTDVECPHCQALAYSMNTHIEGGMFDTVFTSNTYATLPDAIKFADTLTAEYSGNAIEQDVVDSLRMLYFMADHVGKEVFGNPSNKYQASHVLSSLLNSCEEALNNGWIEGITFGGLQKYLRKTMFKEESEALTSAGIDLWLTAALISPFLALAK